MDVTVIVILNIQLIIQILIQILIQIIHAMGGATYRFQTPMVMRTKNIEDATMKTIIAEVTYKCNLQCKYCCVGNAEDLNFMSDETVINLHLKVSKWNEAGETTIIWHGGEPLLAGIDFFKRILEIQKSIPNHKFLNCIQSNGTLLNDTLFDFFEENEMKIGISLDGLRVAHDINRPYKNGQSSFYDTLYWIKKRKIGGAICILNKNTSAYIELIYDFSKENKIKFKFNPQNQMGRALINDDLELTNEELTSTYIRLFDLWYQDKREYRADIDLFDNITNGLIAINNRSENVIPYNCNFKNDCQYKFLCVSPNGDLYPCGRFVGEKEFLYGNINEEGEISDKLDNHIRQRFLERHKGLIECESCKYKELCNSGCPHTSYLAYNDIMQKHPLCTVYKKLYEYIQKKIFPES